MAMTEKEQDLGYHAVPVLTPRGSIAALQNEHAQVKDDNGQWKWTDALATDRRSRVPMMTRSRWDIHTRTQMMSLGPALLLTLLLISFFTFVRIQD